MKKNYKFIISYDGSRFYGWEHQPDRDTIQGKLEQVLGRMTGQAVEVIGSGRTDAGVHALGQVANFHAATAMTAPEILAYLRAYLPEDIGVTAVTAVDERFHSRYNALEKTYCYRVFHSDGPCVFQRRYVYQMAEPLDLEAMEAGAARLLGQHDFLPFSSLKKAKKSTVRTLRAVELTQVEEELRFTLTADGFLYHMVRILVGTLLAVGRGRIAPGDIDQIFALGDRSQAGETVPAKGLCLMEVKYP